MIPEFRISPISRSSGYFSSFDGTQIYYEVRGEGKPLVFVYGIACLINHWHLQIDHFSKNYQTIVFDYRGHHFTEIPKDKSNLSLEAISKDIICLCEHLNISEATFLGHSFGTEVLLQTYLEKPELFAGIGMISGFFSNPFEHLLTESQLAEAFTYLKMAYNQAPSLLSKIWKFGVTNPVSIFLSAVVGGFNLKQTSMKDIEIYAQGVANIDFRVFMTLFEQLIRYNGMQDLPRLKTPTLIIAGDKDSLTPTSTQEQIHSLVEGSQLQLIEGGSHCVQLDFPEIVNERIDSFLKEINY